MTVDDLTIGQVKELVNMLSIHKSTSDPNGLNCMIGEKVIVRTYSSGVWFGTLEQKASNEVIIKDARRLWRWKAVESISLSAVALYGIQQDESKITPAVPRVWVEAIELIPCTSTAIASLEEAPNAAAG